MFDIHQLKYKEILNIKSMNIPANKVTSIIGASGSGKTTLIRLLNKLISPDKGEIFFENTPLSEIDSVALRKEVVMLPQEPVIFDGTIKDNLLIGLIYSKKALVDDSTLNSYLDFVKLSKNLNDTAANLSGGEKQRLALARVLLLTPKVLLLDEPSSSLDTEAEDFVINKVVNYIKENNKTLIMVTHSKDIAEKYSDNIITINKIV